MGLPFGTSLSCLLLSPRFLLMAAYSVLQLALLITPAFHSRASLRSNDLPFHSGFIRFSQLQSTGCPLCARLLVATGFGAVMPFCERKGKSPASPLLQAVAIHNPFQVFPVCHRLAPLADGSRLKNKNGPQGIAAIFVLNFDNSFLVSKIIHQT